MALLLTATKRKKDSGNFSRPCRHLSQADPVLQKIIAQVGPCQLRPRRQYFPTLCDSIVSQQLSTKAAETIYARFANLYSRRRPTPKLVLNSSIKTLRGVGLSQQKAGYIKDLAAGFSDGRIQPRTLYWKTNEEIIQTLCAIKGIGRWTAEMFLMFSLNRLDVLPVDDLGIRKAVQRWYRLHELPKPTKLIAVGKCWHPYETVASWYLWQSLRL